MPDSLEPRDVGAPERAGEYQARKRARVARLIVDKGKRRELIGHGNAGQGGMNTFVKPSSRWYGKSWNEQLLDELALLGCHVVHGQAVM